MTANNGQNKSPATPSATAPVTKPDSMVAYLRSRAAIAPLVSADLFGTPLTPKVEALGQLDVVLAKAGAPVSAEEKEAIVTTFGAFLGETLRANHGGEWTEDEDGDWGVANTGTTGTFVNPFEWVRSGNVAGQYEAWARTMPTKPKNP